MNVTYDSKVSIHRGSRPSNSHTATARVCGIGGIRRFLSNLWLRRSMSWVGVWESPDDRARTVANFTANSQVFCR
jgi:hypothetical protein